MDEFRFWPMEFDEAVKSRLTAALQKKGIEVIQDDYVTELSRLDGTLTVRTRKREIKTDIAILTSGMVPCLDFLEDSGLDLQEGVLVNERLESSGDSIWAAGECAQIYYPEIKDYRCSTGYRNAEVQGELAAKNMLGGSEKAYLLEPGKVIIAGEQFLTYGWRGFSLDETN
jgi:3-phenylpropionate/trans-cinnamate dioxygenase ferredoxin reductase subunit